jgi:hypothetical protein
MVSTILFWIFFILSQILAESYHMLFSEETIVGTGNFMKKL